MRQTTTMTTAAPSSTRIVASIACTVGLSAIRGRRRAAWTEDSVRRPTHTPAAHTPASHTRPSCGTTARVDIRGRPRPLKYTAAMSETPPGREPVDAARAMEVARSVLDIEARAISALSQRLTPAFVDAVTRIRDCLGRVVV